MAQALNHRAKQRLARKMQTREELREKGRGIFDSAGWLAHAKAIADRVLRNQKKSKAIKIVDDKGKKHKEGEIFQNTVTLET